MIQIQDVTVPTKGVGKYFSLMSLNIPLPGTTASFYWSVYSETETQEPEPKKQPGSVVLEGNLTMDAETYAQWGTDDDYAIDWALNQLGFQRK
jgi:hypothetical protein